MKKITPAHYAQALYVILKRDGVCDEEIKDLRDIQEKFNESPSFYRHLQFDKSTLNQKKEDLKSVFQDFISERSYKFLMLLINNKHLKWLEKIIAEIESIKKVDEETVDADIFTPVPLEEVQRDKIRSILAKKLNKQVIISEKIDEKLIGGIKISVAGLIIDGSIKGRLENLTKQINNIE